MELLCPAGSIPAVKAAVEHGADAIYIGFKDATNARHFAGLNFEGKNLQRAADFIHQHHKKLHIAINTYAHPQQHQPWFDAIDRAVDLGADTVILADMALLDYAATQHPKLEIHLSVQASATNAAAIAFYKRNFNISRVVLPRVLSIHQVKQLANSCPDIELEVFAFGSLCIMAEGRCYLSSYLTGESPNTAGACSPAAYVRWRETNKGLESRLNDVLIDCYAPGESAGYPTLCKGRFCVDEQDHPFHVLEEPTSLNTLEMLPELARANISAVKIEGRQRSPAYVAQVTKVWRSAIDNYLAAPDNYQVKQEWMTQLGRLSEGHQTTLGAYHRAWQ